MSRQEALTLFEQVSSALCGTLHPYTASLYCVSTGGLLGTMTWWIAIDSWDKHWLIHNQQDWQEYKRVHAVLETDEDLEQYAESARVEAQ